MPNGHNEKTQATVLITLTVLNALNISHESEKMNTFILTAQVKICGNAIVV